MTGWLMLIAFGGFVLIDVITIGPSVLSLIASRPTTSSPGRPPSSSSGPPTMTAVVGRARAPAADDRPILEYSILTVFIVWAFIAVYIVHSAGTVSPNLHW